MGRAAVCGACARAGRLVSGPGLQGGRRGRVLGRAGLGLSHLGWVWAGVGKKGWEPGWAAGFGLSLGWVFGFLFYSISSLFSISKSNKV